MRWLMFLVTALVALAVQVAAMAALRLGEARPDLLLVLLVFVALHAPVSTSLYAAIVAGLLQDVAGHRGMGVHVVGYVLAMLAMLQLRSSLYRESGLAHATLAGVGALVVLLWTLARWAVYAVVGPTLRFEQLPEDVTQMVGVRLGPAMIALLLTLLAGWPGVAMLTSVKKAFAFKPGKID